MIRRLMAAAVGIVTLSLPATGAAAQIVGVVPENHSSIQAAIDAASAGDTIRVRAGTYTWAVSVNKPVTLEAYGDGPAIVDAGCSRANAIQIAASSATVRGLHAINSVDAAVLIDGRDSRPSNVTVDQLTITNFDCGNQGPEYRAGIGSWYAGSEHRITNNTIMRRADPAAWDGGQSNGIWFKSSSDRPSGGGHHIAHNVIRGVYDGIGGEVEDDPHGGFDKDTRIEFNDIEAVWDDGISVEGGTANVVVGDNVIRRAAIGIANAPNLTGPVSFERNRITEGRPGEYDNVQCFKIGDRGGGVAHYTGNTCILDGGDGWAQTNPGVNPIVSRNNEINVGRYVVEISSPIVAGHDWDFDCLYTSDPDRFVKWNDARYVSLAEWRAAQSQELSGVEDASCGLSDFETAAEALPTRTPEPTATALPQTAAEVLPTRTPEPTATARSEALPTPDPVPERTPTPTRAPAPDDASSGSGGRVLGTSAPASDLLEDDIMSGCHDPGDDPPRRTAARSRHEASTDPPTDSADPRANPRDGSAAPREWPDGACTDITHGSPMPVEQGSHASGARTRSTEPDTRRTTSTCATPGSAVPILSALVGVDPCRGASR